MRILTLILLIALATSALAERTVTFAWDATEDADSYTLYVNGAPVVSTTETQITIQIADARTVVNVTASNIAGESEPSETLSVPPAPTIPKGFRISKIVRTTTAIPK
jgi:hypothetical protein